MALPPALRVMLVDDSESRSLELRLMLTRLGHEVVAEVFNPRELYGKVRELAPDVIIIDTESPSRDTLEHVALLSERHPRPIVMVSVDRTSELIRAATGDRGRRPGARPGAAVPGVNSCARA